VVGSSSAAIIGNYCCSEVSMLECGFASRKRRNAKRRSQPIEGQVKYSN
jgi:hypothetical protein